MHITNLNAPNPSPWFANYRWNQSDEKASNKFNSITLLIDDTLKSAPLKEISKKEPASKSTPLSTTQKISQLFKETVKTIQSHSTTTTIIFCVTAGLGASLAPLGGVISMLGSFALLSIALAIHTLKFIGNIKQAEMHRIADVLDQLELAKVIKPQESIMLKKALKEGNGYSEACQEVIERLKDSHHVFEQDFDQLMKLLKSDKIDSFFKQVRQLAFCASIESDSRPMPLPTTAEVRTFIDQLEDTESKALLTEDLNKNSKASFRTDLVSYYKKEAESQKKQGNLIAYYSMLELAKKFKNGKQDVYVAVVRMMSFKNRAEERNKMLGSLTDLMQELHQCNLDKSDNTKSGLETLQSKLQELHTNCDFILKDYDVVNKNCDYLYSTYFGHFNQKLKTIDDLLSQMQKGDLSKVGHIQTNILADNKTLLKNKSVLLATCSYGTGHKRAAEALAKQIEGAGGRVAILDPTAGGDGIFIKDIDWVNNIARKFGSDGTSVKAFNWILQEQQYWMVNLENKVDGFIRGLFGIKGKNGVATQNKGIDNIRKERLRQQFLMQRPDLVVTTYHMDLNTYLEVCEELGIPLLHLPTDLDVKAWEVFNDTPPDYQHFKCFLPDASESTLKSAAPLTKAHLQYEQNIDWHREVAGIALRPEFYLERSVEEIKKLKEERGIDPEAKVVLVLSGGNGQEVPYPEDLMNSDDSNGQKYHMIVVAGGNKAAGDRLNAMRKKTEDRFITGKNRNVTVEVAKGPETGTQASPYFIGAGELSRLHAIADAAITKPGGLSMAELLQTGVPILADRRVIPMSWEDFNIAVVQQKNRGDVYEPEGFQQRLGRILDKENRSHFIEKLDKVIALGKQPQKDCSKMFTQQMFEMINKAESDQSIMNCRNIYASESQINNDPIKLNQNSTTA